MGLIVNGHDDSLGERLTVVNRPDPESIVVPESQSDSVGGLAGEPNFNETFSVVATKSSLCISWEAAVALSEQQIERYSRHIILEGVGGSGQEKLLAAKVLIIGAGGLGSPAALYLAAAGVGTIGLVDADKVDLTNLQRQIIHRTPDVGLAKVESAGAKINALNPDVTVNTYAVQVRADNIREIISPYDFVIDCTDNFAAKFLVNDACYFERKPFSHAGVLRFQGQLMTVLPGKTTCYRCIFDSPPPTDAVPSCSQAGVLGVLAGVMGSLQAAEAVKHILGLGQLLTDALLTCDIKDMQFRKVPLRRNPDCPICGDHPRIIELADEQQT